MNIFSGAVFRHYTETGFENKNFKKNYEMKNFAQTACYFICILALNSCSSTTYLANWQTKPVVADGIPTEWSLPLRYSDSESGLQYCITNDETNLYICLRATEQQAQLKIFNSGLNIYLYPSGKNKDESRIQFPLPLKHDWHPVAGNMKPDMIKGNPQNAINFAEQYNLQDSKIILSGFQSEYNGTFKTTETKGFKEALGWDKQNILTYELIVPIRSLFINDIKTLKDNPVIGVKIYMDPLSFQGGGNHGGEMKGVHPGGGGPNGGVGGQGNMPMGGGGPGSEMGGRPPENLAINSLSSSTSIKFKIQLNGIVKK